MYDEFVELNFAAAVAVARNEKNNRGNHRPVNEPVSMWPIW